jgi:glycosyltransferase involved in cell wall biosynthesis
MSETVGKGLNIAMFGQKRVPSREGGIEVVEEIAPRMVADGNKVTCYNRKRHLAVGEDFKKMRRAEYKGVRLKDVFTVDRRGLAAVTSSMTASIQAAFGRYDVVHIHAEGPAFMCWLPKLFGKRVVTTIHGLDHERSKWGKFASAFIMMGERNAVRFSDEIIVLSQETKKYFKDKYNRNTVFIPNGVDRPEIKEANIITEKFGLEKDSYILFLGRIVPEKGIQYLINAFKEVRTDKKLVIAGASGDTDRFVCELKQMAKSDDRIMFTGFVEGEELEEMFSNAYIYTLPSDLEGMPISLLEAMSFGNCCLTSDISECADVIEDYGITFKKGDVWSLREKLQSLCDSPDIVAEYKSKAADFICDKYSWDVTVDKTLELYKK